MQTRYLEVDGTAPWLTDPDAITSGIEEFLTGSHAAPAQSHRALRTVLFTDIVASTERAAATGDERWRAVLQRFGEITAELTQRFGGAVVKSTGDGRAGRVCRAVVGLMGHTMFGPPLLSSGAARQVVSQGSPNRCSLGETH